MNILSEKKLCYWPMEDEISRSKLGEPGLAVFLFDLRNWGNIEIFKVRPSSCLSKSLQSKYRLQIKTDIQILNPLESLNLMSRVKLWPSSAQWLSWFIVKLIPQRRAFFRIFCAFFENDSNGWDKILRSKIIHPVDFRRLGLYFLTISRLQ